MKIEKAEVKTTRNKQRVLVGVVEFPVFDTWAEACEHPNYGEKRALELLNVQVKTTAMNQIRAAANPRTSNAALKDKALTRISSDAELVKQFLACGGDEARVKDLIQEVIDQIREEMGLPTEEDEEQEDAAAAPAQ